MKSMPSDEDLKKRPQQFLSIMISYRNSLRSEMEITNSRINQLDQKIIEMLQHIALAPNLGEIFSTMNDYTITDPTINTKPGITEKGNIVNILKKTDEFELEKLRMKKNYLDIHSTMRNDSFMFDNMSDHFASSSHSNFKDNQKVFALIFIIACWSLINFVFLFKSKNLGVLSSMSLMPKNNILPNSDTTMPKNNLIAMRDDTGSCMNLHEASITINEIRTSPKPSSNNKHAKDSNHRSNVPESSSSKTHLKAHSKRDALGSSTAISSAVAGATSLLQSVINTADKTPKHAGSNYNVNLIRSESGASKKQEKLKASASDQGFKDARLKRYMGKDKESDSDQDSKLKLLKNP